PPQLLYFFSYAYRDHPPLHSFPTRRSSDLEGSGDRTGTTHRLSISGPRAAPAGSHAQELGEREPGPGDRRQRKARIPGRRRARPDRKSTRLNSSHVKISYAVFCLKKKKKDR